MKASFHPESSGGNKRVANQEERDDQKKSRTGESSTDDESQTGDPGRTPGTAEGDEQTVDEDLRRRESQGQK
jgi:hypothetical protein